jgi:hypothetical protein
MKTYKGKIRIAGLGHAVDVSATASNPQSAKKVIQNQFKVKHWVQQPAQSK